MSENLICAAKRVIDNWDRGDLAQAVRDLSGALSELDYASAEEIKLAREIHVGRGYSVEVDDGAITSRANVGLWVQAWVWVDNPDEEVEEEVETV